MLKAVILDIDGVILLGKKQIAGAEEAIGKLRAMGYRIFFLSNNSSRSRRTLVEKLVDAGVTASIEESYPASYGTAVYVSEKYPKSKSYVISGGGMQDEFRARGLEVVEDENAGVVAVGFDTGLTYQKLTAAFRAIMKGAVFIASNEDKTYPVEDGLKPGAGAIVAALEFSCGKKPKVIGKPSTYMLKMIMKEHKLRKEELVVVGDRFDMDIAMAKKAGIKSVLVLSGVSSREDVGRNGNAKPDLVLGSLSELPGRIRELNYSEPKKSFNRSFD